MKEPPFTRKCSICGLNKRPRWYDTHKLNGRMVYVCNTHTMYEAQIAFGDIQPAEQKEEENKNDV